MKKENTFIWKKELKMCILIFFMAILTYCVLIRIWNWDLQVPFSYYSSGDITGLLSIIKNYVNGESLGNVLSMSAPFGTNRLRSLFDASFCHVVIWILAQVTKNVGYTINIYYILTFGLSAVCTYILLRKLNVSVFSSFVCGMVYAFIPGAILRGEGHIFVGSIFMLPLSALVIIYFMRGEFCKPEFQYVERISLKETIKSVDKKLILGIVVMTMLSLSTVYYAVFAMILLTFALLYVCLEKKQVRHIYYYGLLTVSQVLTWGLIFIPQFLNTRVDDTYRPISMVSRAMSDVETYGLKLAQLFLPISNHRISFLAGIRRIYDTNFLGINENGMATLGAVMSIGAIIGALSVFYNVFRKNEIIMLSGKLIVFSIIVAVVGGLASFVGMLTYSIRCYNRFSFFIGCFAVIIVATILDICIDRIGLKVKKNIVKQCMCMVLGVVLIVGAVLDQTPKNIAYDEVSSIQLSARYFRDKKFVEDVEMLEEGDEMILVLPMETMFGYTTDNEYVNYDTHLMYLHSESSSWSTGGNPGEAGWRWLRTLANSEWNNILTTAAVMGYSGIAMYTEGYTEDKYADIREFMESKLGKADVVHDDASWEYYSLGEFAEDLKSSLSQEEFEVLKKHCSQVVIDFYEDELYCTDPTSSENPNSILVKQDAIQYGPYTFLEEGKYMITVKGDNLSNCDFYVNVESGSEQIDIEMLEVTDESVTYSINLLESKNDVEFCCLNIEEEMVTINSISVYPYTEEYIEGYKIMERILDNTK